MKRPAPALRARRGSVARSLFVRVFCATGMGLHHHLDTKVAACGRMLELPAAHAIRLDESDD